MEYMLTHRAGKKEGSLNSEFNPRDKIFCLTNDGKMGKGSTDGKCDTETTERNNMVQKQTKREDIRK